MSETLTKDIAQEALDNLRNKGKVRINFFEGIEEFTTAADEVAKEGFPDVSMRQSSLLWLNLSPFWHFTEHDVDVAKKKEAHANIIDLTLSYAPAAMNVDLERSIRTFGILLV